MTALKTTGTRASLDYLTALGLTVGVEVPMVAWFAARYCGTPVGYAVFVGFGANFLTHGVLWTTFGWFAAPYVVKVLIAEALVWLTEAAIYRTYRVLDDRALAVSLAANAITTAIGLWSMALHLR